MDKIPARVISDDRITIPEEFRDTYDEEGDFVMVAIESFEGDESGSTLSSI